MNIFWIPGNTSTRNCEKNSAIYNFVNPKKGLPWTRNSHRGVLSPMKRNNCHSNTQVKENGVHVLLFIHKKIILFLKGTS